VPILGSRLADVGTGAGFPGIPLRMAIPDLNLTLIEPNAKKTAFLSEVVRRLELGSTRVIRSRMEDMGTESGRFDFITARALGRHDEFLRWSRDFISESGSVVLWLGESDAKTVALMPGWHWQLPIPIPLSERRQILVGSQ